MRWLIQGGMLVDSSGSYRRDLLIEDGLIRCIQPSIPPESTMDIINAEGLYVMPGGIDVHTHFNIDVGLARSCDDFFSGTRAAACGGTTTIIDHMGFGPTGCSLHHQLGVYHDYAKDQAVIDYSFHGVVQHIDDAILDEMHSMVEEEGISSFKLYLTYKYKLDDDAVLKALRQLHQVGALTTVHPENDAAIALRRAEYLAQGKTSPAYHALSRPLECEAESIAKMINLAKLAGNSPLYIVHLSNGLGLDYVRLAKAAGQAVWAETCPQYLLLDELCYQQEDALKYVLSPPLRAKGEQDKLWVGIADGSFDVVATDHCTFPYTQRLEMGAKDFSKCPNGLPGVENRMMLLFSEGVMRGRISPNRFVELTSEKPAKLFGLWPQKGTLQVGSDADVVLFDPQISEPIRHENLHDNADYSPYEGMVCQGAPVLTMSRGEIVSRNGQFTGRAGWGRFIPRQKFHHDEKE